MDTPKDEMLALGKAHVTPTDSVAIRAKSLSVPGEDAFATRRIALALLFTHGIIIVRVIYTLNTSTQSLLARHRRKVEVVPIESSTDPMCHASSPAIGKDKFAKVSLKTCLGAVCTSSPELLADRSRDYSIYVVDPLETVYSSNNNSETGSFVANNSPGAGVSIGVGLLSWCLSSEYTPMEGADTDDDDGYVVGRMVKDRGTETLEIVMSLRETAPQTQKAHVESLSSLGLSGCVTPDCGKVSTARIGRPPGTATHPKKRARRLAIQSHKQTLDKMQNIAKMQRGEPYDGDFVDKADFNAPKVTDADIARQKRTLEELESRPLIIDKPSNPLTTKPLRKSVSTSSTTIKSSKNSCSKQVQNSASSANALASGSEFQNQVASTEDNLSEKSDPMSNNKQGTELFLSLLTSVLSKVDSTSPAQSSTTAKGKEKEAVPVVDAALAAALGRLIPLLPGAAHPTVYPQPVTSNHGSGLVSTAPQSSTSFRLPHYDVRQQFYSGGSSPMLKPPSLFPTADETFNCSDRASTGPHEQRWTSSRTPSVRSDPPKVREDAYPVPGGGWARGKNLVPRTTMSTKPTTPPPPAQEADQNANNSPKLSTAIGTPDKENMPPPQSGRGLKRCSSALMDGKDSHDGSPSPVGGKKRKHERKAANSSGETKVTNVLGTKKMMGPTGGNKATTSGATGFMVAASSPIRSTTTAISIMAASEPDYLSTSMPIVAASHFPDVILQPPRTPPRRKMALEDAVNDSLFTPAPKSITLLDSGATASESSLFSPSPVRGKKHHSLTANVVNTTDGPATAGRESDSHLVRTGWDLPPSSPPPPTSPISPRADIGPGEGDQPAIDWGNTSEPDDTNEKCDSDETLGQSHGTTFKCDNDSTNSSHDNPLSFTFQNLGATSDFDPLSDAGFDFSMLDQIPVEHEGIELDVDELWKSLGPVIAQAQTDVGVVAEQQTLHFDQTSFDYFGTGDNNIGVEVDGQNALDPIKLAEDLKALFGGCVV
ncbi:hypothetical protein BU17DRAFT_93628 [Hysterangium stoloniferum]|nr:hypothetical protein BU17DRAFT_93628 [Hysterangium stoloniferum]